MLPVRAPGSFRVVAHRGASGYAPENTAAAFRRAVELGATEVELDTQLSTDGEVFLCHDLSLGRYGHGDRVVQEMSSAELLALDMGAWFPGGAFAGEPMMTLDALFGEFGDRLTYDVELKGRAAELPRRVIEVMRRHGVTESCIASSFRLEHLAETRSIAPGLRRAWLMDEISPGKAREAAAAEFFQLCPSAGPLTPAAVELGHSVAREVRAWGATGSADEVEALIRRAVRCGCDAMTIDWPDWIVRE